MHGYARLFDTVAILASQAKSADLVTQRADLGIDRSKPGRRRAVSRHDDITAGHELPAGVLHNAGSAIMLKAQQAGTEPNSTENSKPTDRRAVRMIKQGVAEAPVFRQNTPPQHTSPAVPFY